MSRTARLFVAIRLPGRAVDAIVDATRALRGGDAIRPVPPEQIHLTLRFLGAVPLDAIEELSAALASRVAAVPPFGMRVHGAGAFPGLKRPSVLWVGVRSDPAVLRAREAVEAAVLEVGFAGEPRRFRPHITVARIRRGTRPPPRLADEVGRVSLDLSVDVDSVRLVESELSPRGAVHTDVRRFPLLGTGARGASEERG